jgi:hypothetical protein
MSLSSPMYLGGSEFFDESTGTYTDGRSDTKDIPAVPNLPESIPQTRTETKKAIKVATPDIVLFNEDSLPIDAMSGLIFEQIGGQELINMTRHDTVNGRNVSYQLLSNNVQLANSYNSNNIMNTPGTLQEYFKNFAIRLDTHVPEYGSGPNGSYVYLENESQWEISTDFGMSSGALIVDVMNMKTNEQVEIQILNGGTYLDDIIEFMEES